MIQTSTTTATMAGPRPQMVWVNILFFAFITLVTLIAAPLYLYRHGGIPTGALWLMGFYIVATGMGITVGYHRLFAHVNYKASPIVEFLLLFFGAAAFEQSALKWAVQHRDHHRYVDTDQDPYSIKKGFFYAHVGWLMFWRHVYRFEIAPDLQKNKMLMHQHKNYHIWAIGSGILVPTLIGAMFGWAGAAFIFAVCVRLVFVYNATFCINSVCHMFGRSTYDIYSTAKDHWFVALLTYGEGYHNFHHRFPGDYRNGVRWYHWDPSKWMIAFLQWIGLAQDLRRVSDFRILEARLEANQQRLRDLVKKREHSLIKNFSHNLEVHHKILLEKLAVWESKTKAYREIFYGNLQDQSQKLRAFAQKEMELAQQTFHLALEEWQRVVRSHSEFASFAF